MHELTITQNILAIVLEKAREVRADKIRKVSVTLGDLSGIVDECVQFYFELLGKDTIASEATLSFERVPTKLKCRRCAGVFSPGELDWACPACKVQDVEIVSGRECYVDSIEVD